MDVYGNVTLEMALKDRKASVNIYEYYKCCNSEITLDVIISCWLSCKIKTRNTVQNLGNRGILKNT